MGVKTLILILALAGAITIPKQEMKTKDWTGFASMVYDITNTKDELLQDVCGSFNSTTPWELPEMLYFRYKNISILHSQNIKKVLKNIAGGGSGLEFGLFLHKRDLCDLQKVTDTSTSNEAFGEKAAIILSHNDAKFSESCPSLCLFLLNGFDFYYQDVGIDVNLAFFDCINLSCPYVFRKLGFIILSIDLDKISSMLSYGGYARELKFTKDYGVFYWKRDNPLGIMYLRLVLNTTVGLEIKNIDKIIGYIHKLSGWWLKLYRPVDLWFILDGSKTFSENSIEAGPIYSTNLTVFPRVDLNNIYNSSKPYSICYFWHMFSSASGSFLQFFMHIDKWESAAMLVKNAESLCNIYFNANKTIFIHGKDNSSFIETLKNQTKDVQYAFPTLTFLVSESLNDTFKNMLYVKSVIEVENRDHPTNNTLGLPYIIFQNVSISAREKLPPVLPELDIILKIRKMLMAENRFVNATFFIEFNITNEVQLEKSIRTENLYKANLFCSDSRIKIRELQEALLNWAMIHDIVTIPFPLVDTNTNLGYSYDVATTPALRRNQIAYSVTVRRNLPDHYGENGQSSQCFDKCTESSCIEFFDKHRHSGVTLQLDDHLQQVNLTETDLKNFILLAFFKFRIVEVVVSDPNLFKSVIQTLTQDFKKEIARIVQRGLDDIVLYVFFFGDKNSLLDLDISKLIEFSVHGLHIPDWQIEETTEMKLLDNLETLSTTLAAGIGIDVINCVEEINMNFTRLKRHKVFHLATHIVCHDNGYIEASYVANERKIQLFLDTHFFIQRYIRFTINKDTYFRVLFNVTCKTQEDIDSYSNFQSYISRNSEMHEINYFFGDAFLNCSQWNITNYKDLGNTSSYGYVQKLGEVFTPVIELFKDPPPNQTNPPNLLLMIGLPLLSLFAFCTILSTYVYFKLRKPRLLSREEVRAFLSGEQVQVTSETIGVPYVQVSTVRSLGFNKVFEISKKDMSTGCKIGTGNFGDVYKGTYKETQAVAIKQPVSKCSKEVFKTMLAEVKVLSYLGNHENVLKFVGAYTKQIDVGIIYVVTELCENGTLVAYIQKIRKQWMSRSSAQNIASLSSSLESELSISTSAESEMDPTYYSSTSPTVSTNRSDYVSFGNMVESDTTQGSDVSPEVCVAFNFGELCRFATEIANGMEYIAARKVVHSDLSARNVLLTQNNTCKIADFGLSRKLYEKDAYIKQGEEALPWPWMAPESLNNMEFTTKSDIWSYEITLWEIFSLGETPYADIDWNPRFQVLLEEGLRLSKPEHATEEIFEQMEMCWKISPEERPTFSELWEFFHYLTINNSED